MKPIKDLLIVLLSFFACFSFVACKDDDNETKKENLEIISFQSLFDMCGKSTVDIEPILKNQEFIYSNHYSSGPIVFENYFKIINTDTVAYILGTYDGIIVTSAYFIPVNNRNKAHSLLINKSKEAYNFVNTGTLNDYRAYIDDTMENSTNYYNHDEFLSALQNFDYGILEYCFEYTEYDNGNKFTCIDYNWLCMSEEFHLTNDADDNQRDHFIRVQVFDFNVVKKKTQIDDATILKDYFKSQINKDRN